MAEKSDEVFIIYNWKNKELEYINPAFEKITKRKRDDIINNPDVFFEFVHKDDIHFLKSDLNDFLNNLICMMVDFRVFRTDGLERWIRLKIYPIVNNDQLEYIVGVGEDDSARKATIFNMEIVNGWKNSLLAIVSHDLRGPIGLVRNLAAIINKKLPGEENKEIHELTRMIDTISQRNLKLINDLFKREAIDTEGVEVSKERVDIVWEIQQMMEIYNQSQESIGKSFLFTTSHDKVFAEVDSMKFLQVVNNLISNSIKFTPIHGVINVHVEKLDKTAVISVEDNGIGVPKKFHRVLFDKYTSAGRKGLKGEESVGLGMWIVKTLTEAHGGKVWFESEEGKGAKFYVEIPLGLLKAVAGDQAIS